MLSHPVLRVESEPVSVLAARVVSYLTILIMRNTIIMISVRKTMIILIMRNTMIMINMRHTMIMISMINTMIILTVMTMMNLMMKELTARRGAVRGRGQEVRI